MWRFLFQHVISQSPWVGFGYGAIWSISLFRSGMGQAVGWPYPVLLGDNGFIDILLSVGILGSIPFLGAFILAWIRSIKIGFERKQLIDFFPLVIMVFATFANISFSLFLETESFIWLLMVAVLFIPPSAIGNTKVVSPSDG
jgi:O-antigen ligase